MGEGARRYEIHEEDHVVHLHEITWRDFESLLAMRGDRPSPRMYYLDGEVELVSPSRNHEIAKKTFARLLEYWAVENDLEMVGVGSWTLKKELKKAGGEPDECYIVGRDKDVPDIVIEVEWSRVTTLMKHEIYRRLGVRELWTLKRDGSFVLRRLEKQRWVVRAKSKVLPALDIPWLLSFLDRGSQTEALRKLRRAMRDA